MEKFLKIEELKEKNLQEFLDELTKNLDAYKAEVDKITDIEELRKEMDIVNDIMNSDKSYIDTIIYQLPSETEFNPNKDNIEIIKASKVFNDIIYFLNKNEVEWSYTLGLYQLVLFWKSNPKEISYAIYDSTLRTLNQIKYKGFDEWKNILVINNYMTACHEDYIRDTNWLKYHYSLFNILMDREKLLNKESGIVDDTEAVQEDMIKDASK